MIDLRSDTVTQPSAEMLADMLSAKTGDDVYGEDPTVNQLESLAAQITGKASALFVTSGTQGNLLALLSHCERGDEYIAGQEAHTYRYEAGGGAVLGSLAPQPLAFNKRGELDLVELAKLIKPDDFHFAKTRLVCLENTQAGKPLALDYLKSFSTMCDDRGLKKHLDGARLFNAVVKQGVDLHSITQYFDSISICLSKGLAAPVGSILVGDNETISKARRWRKMLGGGMRQAGILAAAGIYALNHNINRLADDHERTMILADSLRHLAAFPLLAEPETNMLLLDMPAERFSLLQKFLAENEVKVSTQRWVLHRDIGDRELERVIDLCLQFNQSFQTTKL